MKFKQMLTPIYYPGQDKKDKLKWINLIEHISQHPNSCEIYAQTKHDFYYKVFFIALDHNKVLKCDTGGPVLYFKSDARRLIKDQDLDKIDLKRLIDSWNKPNYGLNDDRQLEKFLLASWLNSRTD